MNNNDLLQKLIICKLCNQKYEDPVILPCSNSVCFKHLFKESSSSETSKFDCTLCECEHSKSSALKNEHLSELIQISHNYISLDSVSLGPNNSKAKELCAYLQNVLVEAELLTRDPLNYIDEYFSSLKIEIDLKREIYLKLINENFDRVMKEVEEVELKCKQNYAEIQTSLNESVKESKLKLNKWLRSLRVPDLSKDSEWKQLKQKIEKELDKTNYLVQKYQNDLLLNRDYDFRAKPISEENNFGDLIINEYVFADENRLDGTICLEIEDFSQFKYSTSYVYSKNWCVIKNIPWKIFSRMHETSNYELKLQLFVQPECEDELIKSNPVRAKLTFRILDNSQAAYLKQHAEYTFTTSKSGIGLNEFISYKDIMNEMNNLYDKLSDSIKLEVDIKILN